MKAGKKGGKEEEPGEEEQAFLRRADLAHEASSASRSGGGGDGDGGMTPPDGSEEREMRSDAAVSFERGQDIVLFRTAAVGLPLLLLSSSPPPLRLSLLLLLLLTGTLGPRARSRRSISITRSSPAGPSSHARPASFSPWCCSSFPSFSRRSASAPTGLPTTGKPSDGDIDDDRDGSADWSADWSANCFADWSVAAVVSAGAVTEAWGGLWFPGRGTWWHSTRRAPGIYKNTSKQKKKKVAKRRKFEGREALE